MAGKIYIGTSGWNYTRWKDAFYAGVPRKDWLRYNASHFSGLEVNGSFYRLLTIDATRRWYEQTPDDFRFSIKGHRFITHNKKLKDPQAPLRLQREHAVGLGHKLAVVLWQLPRQSRKNIVRLEHFVQELGHWPNVRHALEFRHESWFDEEVAQCLANARIAASLSDAADWPMWEIVTTDLVYVRLHGHTRTYASAYSAGALDRWAERVRNWSSEGRDVHVYLDNDGEGAAPFDARKLLARLAHHR